MCWNLKAYTFVFFFLCWHTSGRGGYSSARTWVTFQMERRLITRGFSNLLDPVYEFNTEPKSLTFYMHLIFRPPASSSTIIHTKTWNVLHNNHIDIRVITVNPNQFMNTYTQLLWFVQTKHSLGCINVFFFLKKKLYKCDDVQKIQINEMVRHRISEQWCK